MAAHFNEALMVVVCVWFMRDDVITVKKVGHKEEEAEGKGEDFFDF